MTTFPMPAWPETDVLVLCALLALLREWRFVSVWKLTSHRGSAWLFDTQLGAEHPERARIARAYHVWLVLISLVAEGIALADAALYGELAHVVWLHAPLTVVVGFARRTVLRRYVLRARALVPSAPVVARRLVASLRPRSLAEHTNGTFELVNGSVAISALVVLALTTEPSFIVPALIVVYYAIGAWLWKLALVRRPIPLPVERSDEYLQLANDAFRASLRTLDVLRGACTFVLVVFAARVTWPGAWAEHSGAIARGLLALLVVLTLVLLVEQSRSTRSLLARARGFRERVTRAPLADPENLGLGGLVYRNAGNPAVTVSAGPLGWAVNVSNGVTYLYAAYWAGFALLAWLALMRR